MRMGTDHLFQKILRPRVRVDRNGRRVFGDIALHGRGALLRRPGHGGGQIGVHVRGRFTLDGHVARREELALDQTRRIPARRERALHQRNRLRRQGTARHDPEQVVAVLLCAVGQFLCLTQWTGIVFEPALFSVDGDSELNFRPSLRG